MLKMKKKKKGKNKEEAGERNYLHIFLNAEYTG